MSFRTKQASDGTLRVVDVTSGNTASILYPTDSTAGGRQKVLITTYTVPQTENGTTYYLSLAGGFATTLPAPFLGAEYEFIVKTAPTTAYTIVTSASANVIKGIQTVAEVNAVGAADSGTADDTISFVANTALPGDRVLLKSDGTSWFAYATTKLVASLTFTQAST